MKKAKKPYKRRDRKTRLPTIPSSNHLSASDLKLKKTPKDAQGRYVIQDPKRPDKPIKLSEEKLRFVEAYVDPKSPTHLNSLASQRLAYNKPDLVNSNQLEKTPNVKRLIDAAFEAAGVTVELLAQRVREGLDAKKTELVTFQGAVTASVDMIDYGTRHRYIETELKRRGAFPKEDVNVQTALILKIPPKASPEDFEAEFVQEVKP